MFKVNKCVRVTSIGTFILPHFMPMFDFCVPWKRMCVCIYACMIFLSWHKILIRSFRKQWFLIFNCVILIRQCSNLVLMNLVYTSNHAFHILWGTFVTASWNKLIILDGDMKCIILIIFLAKKINKELNSKYRKLQKLWSNTGHIPKTRGSKMLFIPHFLLTSNEKMYLRSII